MPIREEPVYINRFDSVHSRLRRIVRPLSGTWFRRARVSVRNLRPGDGLDPVGESPEEQGDAMKTFIRMSVTANYHTYDGEDTTPFVTLICRDISCGCIMNLGLPSHLEGAYDEDELDDTTFALGTCTGFNWEEGGFCPLPDDLDDVATLINEPDEQVN